MQRKTSVLILALIVAIGISAMAHAGPQAGGWMVLGQSHVDGKSDHDKIKCGDTGTFRAIQLRVSGSAVQFDKVIVRYGNGQSEEIALRNQIPAGGKSRDIDLPGARRAIDRVEFWYQKASWGNNRPTVTLFGIR
ncbi:MAG: hypothetical protein WA354_09670 [Terracidiphilus sp.]